jgi:hypothetical protein
MPEAHEEANIAYHLDTMALELATDDVVFCISEATRAALSSAFPSVASKTRTLFQYVDWPNHFEIMNRNMPPLRLGPYAVVVGTIEPRKNLGLLQSVSIGAQKGPHIGVQKGPLSLRIGMGPSGCFFVRLTRGQFLRPGLICPRALRAAAVKGWLQATAGGGA